MTPNNRYCIRNRVAAFNSQNFPSTPLFVCALVVHVTVAYPAAFQGTIHDERQLQARGRERKDISATLNVMSRAKVKKCDSLSGRVVYLWALIAERVKVSSMTKRARLETVRHHFVHTLQTQPTPVASTAAFICDGRESLSGALAIAELQ